MFIKLLSIGAILIKEAIHFCFVAELLYLLHARDPMVHHIFFNDINPTIWLNSCSFGLCASDVIHEFYHVF